MGCKREGPQSPLSVFLDTKSEGEGHSPGSSVVTWQWGGPGWVSTLPTQALLAAPQGWGGRGVMGLGWGRGCCQKLSVPLGCPFPGPLARKTGIFLGLLLSAPIGSSGF